MTVVLVVAALAIGALVALLIQRSGPETSEHARTMTMMQQQIESFRVDIRESIQHITESVNHQLSSVNQQLQSQTSSIGNRLDNATRVIGDVQRNLGELGRATEEIKGLGLGVAKLEELLRAPKLRGGLGEFLLEDLLRQVLPVEHFQMQHRFRNGYIVDAVIRTSDRLVPVDSKFPLENFRKLVNAATDQERSSQQRAFVSDVKRHIDAIAGKYIVPDEGTFPFALMYIPAENIYYEVIIREEAANGSGLYCYALERKVVPVSPNSFYAYLQVISLGLRGMAIERSAREIVNALVHLQVDVAKARETFDTLGNHIDNARKKYDEADKRLASIETKFEQVADHAAIEERGEDSHAEKLLIS